MPDAGNERERSPHPYARSGRRLADDDSSSYDTRQTPTTLSSESGTEADDERPPQFLKALPPPTPRPAKGLKATPELSVDGSPTPLLTPSQLDHQGRRLSQGYFDYKQTEQEQEQKQPEDDGLQAARRLFDKRRRAERIRRISEGALLAAIGLLVVASPAVWASLWNWHRAELTSQIVTVVLLIAIYPVRIVLFGPAPDSPRPLVRRFRVPASFDPASVLYPTFVPVLVALALLPQYPALLLPNLILGLASLPPRLFPPLSRLKDINVLHWVVSIAPLICSENTEFPSKAFPPTPYKLKAGQHPFLQPELLTLLYPLHQALLPPLHYLTASSLLAAEKHLLSASLINLLLFAASPQAIILQVLLWTGGVWVLVTCTHVARWNVALARVPRWRFRRPTSKSVRSQGSRHKSLVSRVWKLAHPFAREQSDDSDADEDLPNHYAMNFKRPKLGLSTSIQSTNIYEPASAVEADPNVRRDSTRDTFEPSKRRHTIASIDAPTSFLSFSTSLPSQKRQRRPRDWHLNLTAEGAFVYKWLYAVYIYTIIAFIVAFPVRQKIAARALNAAEPVFWAFDYLFADLWLILDAFYSRVNRIAYQDEILRSLSSEHFSVPAVRIAVGAANTRLLLVAYWLVVLLIGLVTVIRLSSFIEVDTRRKVFHAIMVTMLLPSIFVDPCFCSFALGLVLGIFLILEVIRAGQVPPLGIAISRFVAPYIDGRDLRGPMVVSHIFLLIGCAIPLWLSLAGFGRKQTGHSAGWETENNVREVAMVAGVVCVGMGDAAASLIGRRFGRCKWPWIGGKSLEGSGAFAAAVTIGLMAAKAWVRFGGWHETHDQHLTWGLAYWSVEVGKAAVCGCGASFMEAVLTGANDNVVVPVALWLLVKSLNV